MNACENKCIEQAIPISPQSEVVYSSDDFDKQCEEMVKKNEEFDEQFEELVKNNEEFDRLWFEEQSPAKEEDKVMEEVGDVSDDDERHDEGPDREESEEAAECKVCDAPAKPSAAENDRHECMGHVQYRSWCPSCVRGRGQNSPHRSKAKQREHRALPELSMDYFFIGEKDNPTATLIV